jgi:hypothetical protein
LRRAATERRSEIKPKAELLTPAVKSAERQLIRMLMEAEGFREKLAREIIATSLHRGLESEKILELLASKVGEVPDPATLAAALEEKDRRVLFDILFEAAPAPTWESAESCLEFLRDRRITEQIAELETKIQAQPPTDELMPLLREKEELRRQLARKQRSA